MSNYVASLVSRMLAPAASIRPKLPSVFEPVAPAESLAPTAAWDMEDAPPSAPVVNAPTAVEPGRSARASQRTKAALEPSASAERGEVERKADADDVRGAAARVAAHDHESRAVERPDRRGGFAPTGMATFTPRPAEPARSDLPGTPLAPRSADSPPEARANFAPAEGQPRKAGPVDAPVMPMAPITAPESRRADHPLVSPLQPVIAQARRGAETERPLTEAAPSIHISIGRLEIRAIPAPVREAAKTKSSPSLNLADYLRQRAHGGRR